MLRVRAIFKSVVEVAPLQSCIDFDYFKTLTIGQLNSIPTEYSPSPCLMNSVHCFQPTEAEIY